MTRDELAAARADLLDALRLERYGPLTREHHNTYTDPADPRLLAELVDELGDEDKN